MINNPNLIEKGPALLGQRQPPGQQKQKNWRLGTILAADGIMAAQPTGYFNQLINQIRILILNDCLILSFFLMMFLLFMIFIICSVVA